MIHDELGVFLDVDVLALFREKLPVMLQDTITMPAFRLDFRLVNLAASDSLDTFAPSLFLANLAQASSRLLSISDGLRGN